MNDILNNIINRRSVRSFIAGKKIPKQELENIVTAGMFAPSALNLQPVLFTVVTDTEKIQKFAKAVANALGAEETYNFYAPEAIIITSCEKSDRFLKEHTSCALENMFLYAHSVGIGSVWINQPTMCYDEEGVRKVLNEFQIPKNHALGGMMALGYPAEIKEKDLTRKCKVNYVSD